MMTQTQLKKLLDVLNISQRENILDVGCSTGALTEWIADHTQGSVTGIDFSSDAIQFAQQRASENQDRLSFQVIDMNEITLPANCFDTVISIDTLYFVDNIEKTINAIRYSLQEQGRMGIFYSPKISVDESKERLNPENTDLPKALEKCGLKFETWDFTEDENEIWKQSLRITNDLKDQFINEGNLGIYEGRISESVRELEFFRTERKRRYLYHAWL